MKFKTKMIKICSGNRITGLNVQVADTQRKRDKGLMFVSHLPENWGMLFVFPGRTNSGVWMKNTWIPLSIAFLNLDGKIVNILDMEPCTVEPCPIYNPGIFYHYAIEVNRGWFEKNQIKEGDYVNLD